MEIKEKINKISYKLPYFIILVIIIILPPLGVVLLVSKVKEKKKKIYINSIILSYIGFLMLFLTSFSIYSRVKKIIVLIDTGMSLDMINLNFVPQIIFLITALSFTIGGLYLRNICKRYQRYTNLINNKKVKSIKDVSKKTKINEDIIFTDVTDLIKKGYILNVCIDSKTKKLIYNNEEISNDYVSCLECSAFDIIKNKTSECSLCGSIKKENKGL